MSYHGPGPCSPARGKARGQQPEVQKSKKRICYGNPDLTNIGIFGKDLSGFVASFPSSLQSALLAGGMEKWQRDGFDSFGAWRRADQKRRDDARRAALAAAASPKTPPPLAMALAMPIAADARDVYVLASCPGITCSGHGTAHVHQKRVRLASVPVAPVVGQVATPVMPLTVTLTDPEAQSPPRRQLQKSGELLERVEVTSSGSRVHHLERMTPRGSRLTAEYRSPKGMPDPGVSWERSRDAYAKLRLSDTSRSAHAHMKRKAGIPATAQPQAQVRERVPWGYWNGKWLGDGGEDHFLSLSQHDQEEMWRLSGGRGAEYFQYMRPLASRSEV